MNMTQIDWRAHAQWMASRVKRHWLMMLPNGQLWVTEDVYTFDQLIKGRWKSIPVAMLKSYHVENLRALRELRRGMQAHVK